MALPCPKRPSLGCGSYVPVPTSCASSVLLMGVPPGKDLTPCKRTGPADLGLTHLGGQVGPCCWGGKLSLKGPGAIRRGREPRGAWPGQAEPSGMAVGGQLCPQIHRTGQKTPSRRPLSTARHVHQWVDIFRCFSGRNRFSFVVYIPLGTEGSGSECGVLCSITALGRDASSLSAAQ